MDLRVCEGHTIGVWLGPRSLSSLRVGLFFVGFELWVGSCCKRTYRVYNPVCTQSQGTFPSPVTICFTDYMGFGKFAYKVLVSLV